VAGRRVAVLSAAACHHNAVHASFAGQCVGDWFGADMAPTAAHARVRAARCFDEGGLWCMCMCVCVWVVFKTAPRRKERGREGGEGLPCAQPGPLGCQSGAWRRIFYYARLCISRRSPAPGRREGIRCLAWNTAYGRSVLSGRRSGRTIAPQPKAPPPRHHSGWCI